MDVLLVGCGRMGGAMARGWQGAHRVLVFDPMAAELPEGAERVVSLDDVEAGLDVVDDGHGKSVGFPGVVSPYCVLRIAHCSFPNTQYAICNTFLTGQPRLAPTASNRR